VIASVGDTRRRNDQRDRQANKVEFRPKTHP
jgi:hypothetical protein